MNERENAMIDNLDKYKETSINTKTKGELLITLYDEAVKKLTHAKILMESGDTDNATLALDKAIEIFTYLDVTIDYSHDLELAEELHRIYTFLNIEVVKAISKKSVKEVDAVLRLTRQLRDIWEEADKLARTEK